MKLLKLRMSLAFFSFFSTASAFSEALDERQVALIQATAAGICDTVKEAKGSKTNIELQGVIEAKLSGFAKRLASVGGSVEGKYTDETFVGLSRDATATAIEGDRGCRERVFNKMFDKLDRPKDKKTAYKEDGIRADLRKIQDYLRYAPITVSHVAERSVCDTGDADYDTAEFRIEKGNLSIKNHIDSSNERCQSGYRARRDTELTCVAALNDLDDGVEYWSLPNFQIKCLTGDCFKCIEHSRWKNRDQDWTAESREFTIGSANIYVGGMATVKKDVARFNEFGRAIARVISGGSDLNFCTSNEFMCK